MTNYKFNKVEGEHEIVTLKLTHQFALRMAMMICMTIASIVILLGIFFGVITTVSIGILVVIACILGIISFSVTRSALV